MSREPTPMERVVGTLACVMSLSAEVVERRHTWMATHRERTWMEAAAWLIGRPLPPAALTSAMPALEFLLTARFALEAQAQAMMEGGGEGEPDK